jgi:hypothetical protein
MGQSELEITVARADDLQTVVRFFERTAYGAEPTGPDTILLTAPPDTGLRIARREVEIYLGVLEGRHPDVAVSLAG